MIIIDLEDPDDYNEHDDPDDPDDPEDPDNPDDPDDPDDCLGLSVTVCCCLFSLNFLLSEHTSGVSPVIFKIKLF